LNPEYISVQPKLFSSYLPNVLPQMTEEDLAAQMEADRLLQATLRAQGWGSSGSSTATTRKRDLEDAPGPPNRG